MSPRRRRYLNHSGEDRQLEVSHTHLKVKGKLFPADQITCVSGLRREAAREAGGRERACD